MPARLGCITLEQPSAVEVAAELPLAAGGQFGVRREFALVGLAGEGGDAGAARDWTAETVYQRGHEPLWESTDSLDRHRGGEAGQMAEHRRVGGADDRPGHLQAELTGGDPMLTNSYFTAELGRELQREMRARAEGQRLARQFHAQSRAARSAERPRRRLRRALRAVFA